MLQLITPIQMEPYRRPQKAAKAKDDDEVNTKVQRSHETPYVHTQDHSSEPAYYSAEQQRHYHYYQQHHYYPPPPPPPHSYPRSYYHYPHYHYHPAPPVPSPDAMWRPRPSRPEGAAVPVTDDVKHRQDNDNDDRKRPAVMNSRSDSEGSRKLDPYEPIPWNVAQAQPMLVASEDQARANRELPDASKQISPITLKSPPEDQLAYPYHRSEAGSFSPIQISSAHLAGSCYEKNDSIWDIRFKELAAFKRKYGHCNVPQKYPPNKSLGIWVNKQRMEYNKRIDGKRRSSLNDTRLEKLKSLDFRWAKRKGQASWENHYASLVEYKKEYGHCSVPTKYKEDTALGRWVSTQRSEYKKHCEGEPTTMTDEKIRRLEKIGFAWWMGV